MSADGGPPVDVPNEPVGRPMPQMAVEPLIEPERRVGYCVVGLEQFALNQIIPSSAKAG